MSTRRSGLVRGGHSALILAVAACATTPAGKHDRLEFLGRQPVTKQDVLSRLGDPSATFEHDQVLTYQLSHIKGGDYVLAQRGSNSWEGVNYDLVLVFDEQGLLQRHNLVTIRKP